MVRIMNSNDLIKRGFSELVDFIDGGHKNVPPKIGIYIITRRDKDIEYSNGKSDIVKIGKCEFEQGFTKRWYSYFNPGPTQATNKRLKPKFLEAPHGFSWLELPKGQAHLMEKRLLAEFKLQHGQLPAYNLIRS